jgi:AcrR family transcriptional regulator
MKKHREKILKAAVTIFSRKGFHQAQVDEIARRAGVGKGTVYLYFPSKSALFAAAVTDGLETIIAKIQKEIESELPFAEHFRKLIESNITQYLKYSDLARILSSELSSGIDVGTMREIDVVRERYINFIAEILEDGCRRGYIREVNFRLAAVGLVGLLDGLCNYHFKNKNTFGKEQIAESMVTILSSGLLVSRKSSQAKKSAPINS